METVVVLLGIGLVGSFLSGLLGVGGAILLIPLLLYLPPMLGAGRFSMVEIGGMTIVQVLAASLAGLAMHRRQGHFSRAVAWPMSVAIGIGSAIGGAGARYVPDATLQAIFAGIALAAAGLMFLPAAPDSGEAELPADFKPGRAAALAGAVGVISGLMGAGGAFLLAPLMRTALGLPLRLIIGTSLAVVAVSAGAGTIAKALTHQIPWGPTGYLVAGALLGAPLGAKVSKRLPVKALRWTLAVVIALTAIKMATEVWG